MLSYPILPSQKAILLIIQYHLTIHQHSNFYFPILLIKIIYLHNKIYFSIFYFFPIFSSPSLNLYHHASTAQSPPPCLHHAHHATTVHYPPKSHRNKNAYIINKIIKKFIQKKKKKPNVTTENQKPNNTEPTPISTKPSEPTQKRSGAQ